MCRNIILKKKKKVFFWKFSVGEVHDVIMMYLHFLRFGFLIVALIVFKLAVYRIAENLCFARFANFPYNVACRFDKKHLFSFECTVDDAVYSVDSVNCRLRSFRGLTAAAADCQLCEFRP